MSMYFFPQLTDDKRFENLIADIYRMRFSKTDVDEYGRRGQKQYGIDITVKGNSFLWCIQCKNQKNITNEDIDNLLQKYTYYKINSFSKLIIATASFCDTRIVDYLLKIRGKYPFQIEYLPWERICDYIEAYPNIVQKYYAPIKDSMKAELSSIIVEYGIETFIDIDPLVEGLNMDWPHRIDDCVSKLQNLLHENPIRKGEILYQRINELMRLLDAYNGNLGLILFWGPNNKYTYPSCEKRIDNSYEKDEKSVIEFRRKIAILIHEIFTEK